MPTRTKGVKVFLRAIATDNYGWDHVSVSLPNRTPTWEEMAMIKAIFFRPDEAVFQFHPPEADYVNYHPYCLHLWRNQNEKITLPPTFLVGPKTAGQAGFSTGRGGRAETASS